MARSEKSIQYIKPKRIPKEWLSSDERIIVETRYHWSTWGWYEFFKLMLYVVVVAATYDGVPAFFDRIPHATSEVDSALKFLTQGSVWASIYFCAIGIFVWLKLNQWRLLHSTVYAVTDERLLKYKYTSTFRRIMQAFPLKNIEEVELTGREKLKARLLGYGTLTFSTGEGKPAMEWVAVPKPFEVRDKIAAAMNLQMNSHRH